MTATAQRVERLVMRIQRDFLNTPALRMTLSQAERRFRIDRQTSQAILDLLLEARVLTRTKDGAYTRFFPHVAQAA
jgi:hypothetical protein